MKRAILVLVALVLAGPPLAHAAPVSSQYSVRFDVHSETRSNGPYTATMHYLALWTTGPNGTWRALEGPCNSREECETRRKNAESSARFAHVLGPEGPLFVVFNPEGPEHVIKAIAVEKAHFQRNSDRSVADGEENPNTVSVAEAPAERTARRSAGSAY